jgi:hypothetical protein
MADERKPAQAGEPETGSPWRSARQSSLLPALEAARHKLGGRSLVPSERPPGSLVEVSLHDGARRAGILLWASAGTCDIWFDDGLARRARSEAVALSASPTPDALVRVEAEMRMFTALAEGDRVRWERATGITEGRIAEKCRYGAIVVTRSGKLLAVGFRKLWPAAVHATA